MIQFSLITKFIKSAAWQLAMMVISLVIIEGLSNTIIFVVQILLHSRPLGMLSVHVKYDELLGWINIPNIYIKDMYGPGIYLKTNSQSFRNNQDFSINVPKNKLRIICSGDSYTLGLGVDNDHTWCESMSSIDNRLQTVNAGHAAYGIDQSYLLYKQYGSKFEHDIHIFAFITHNVIRMTWSKFWGYAKPVLRLQNGDIVTRNIPVPRQSNFVVWLNRNKEIFDRLGSVTLIRKISRRVVSPSDDRYLSTALFPVAMSEQQAQEIALSVFEDLGRINKAKGSTLVVVYLEARPATRIERWDKWSEILRVELRKEGIVFIDLVPEFRKLGVDEKKSMFDPEYGHYTAQGNEYVARLLYEKLLGVPGVARRLSELRNM